MRYVHQNYFITAGVRDGSEAICNQLVLLLVWTVMLPPTSRRKIHAAGNGRHLVLTMSPTSKLGRNNNAFASALVIP